MSPATGLLGYRDGCCCLFTWETLSPVDLDTCSSRNKSKIVEHKLASFATIVRLCSGKNTSQKLCHFCHCCWESEAILSKKVSCRSPGLNYSYGKFFYHQYRDLGRKVRDFGNRGSPASQLKKLNFFSE